MSADPSHPTLTPTALIIGCGYLGRRLAKQLLDRGQTVYGTTRRQDHAPALAAYGIRPLILTVTQPVTYASLSTAIRAEALDIYYMIPPGRTDGSPSARQTVLGGTAHMIKALRQANVRQAIYISSSAVYGQSNAQRVDADTPPEPQGERAQLLLQGEGLWHDAGPVYKVLRLAGIYGPQRVVGMRALKEGAPLIGNPNAMLNLIHVDDAMSLIRAMTDSPDTGRIELGCDGSPVARITYYQELAKRLGLPAPRGIDDATAAAQFGLNPQRLARTSNKSLDNTATRRRTGWSPAYPDYQAGLDAILDKPAHKPQTTGRTC